MQFTKHDLPSKSKNISEWYNKLIIQAELAEYGPAKGTMIFRPYGYRLWELAQEYMDQQIKAKGVSNAYFPIFIPESLIEKEKTHVKGFSPELAVVTIGGGEELPEKYVVRPTSETIMYHAYAKWVQSWRDLPILINQWNNVVRWEKRTYLFLRTSEFLWQEGHTAHATHDEAWEMVKWAIDMYAQTYREVYALPGIVGRKSKSETFPGADVTLSFESLMPSGKALQSCTSHDLGQNFAKVFDITFQDQDGNRQYVWQTSWGLSTRSLGGLILAHGDDNGLRLPPNIAPFQVVLLPVHFTDTIIDKINRIAHNLSNQGIRTQVDNRDDESLGYRINKWELKGVPLRIEVGEKEVADQYVTLIRRDSGEKIQISESEIEQQIPILLADIQESLYEQAYQYQENNTHKAKDFGEFQEIMKSDRGFIRAFWCGDDQCETSIKAESMATTRCLPLENNKRAHKCIYCGKKADDEWCFAQAY